MTDPNLEQQVAAIMRGAAVEAGDELIDRATNFFGAAVGPEPRERLLALIRDPSPETWDNAYSIILNPRVIGLGRTLWQAVLRVDSTCPTRGRAEGLEETLTADERWNGYAPDALTVITAIAAAVDERR